MTVLIFELLLPYAQGRTNQREDQLLHVLNDKSLVEPQIKGTSPLLPREHPAPMELCVSEGVRGEGKISLPSMK
jgi:hypothetical protein